MICLETWTRRTSPFSEMITITMREMITVDQETEDRPEGRDRALARTGRVGRERPGDRQAGAADHHLPHQARARTELARLGHAVSQGTYVKP